MKTTDFFFDLPSRLIAQFPPETRGASRLMLVDRRSRKREHRRVADLPALLPERPLLVFNDSKVRKARLRASAEGSAAAVEFLLLKQIDALTWETLIQRQKRRRIGSRYRFAAERTGEIIGSTGAYRLIRFDQPIDDNWLDRYGHIPLPPYIKREDAPQDAERYQTVYAKNLGSAAAPTAGLHFTEALLETLRKNGGETVFVTLHVGLGTFLPVRSERVEDHLMHEESFSIAEETARKIQAAKAEGRPVIAVGTTAVRALESSWQNGRLRAGNGVTSIFIYPGYTFNVIDGLFTNFHTPESTLLMLVSAFAGKDLIFESYQDAIQQEYRFFSYGDAMLII
ncbi:MAG: tRNA preQ1(34) S-adenosylmethionine ribosyltransferase-isomerase QueA [Spirochaetaceae bacterium]|jgi:S-adenosylmethionine:tRNA ribosyltransferase-isomerase|nr:tRNA preQ1(34) S-adenosylmethionine ribosyltransferase-isomerase QueA [Spirochaetaceae bacterium]